MPLMLLEDAILPVQKRQKETCFSDLIRDARDAIGLKQYRAAHFVGLSINQIKYLESGSFKEVPDMDVLTAFSRLYDLNLNLLIRKAREHCEEYALRKRRKITFENS